MNHAPLRLVLLGDPVALSRSPLIQQAALDALGLRGSYTARRVDAHELAAAVEELRRGELDGANVTMPHKELAARLSDRVSAEAGRAGSVNTLLVLDGVVSGHSTDVDGLRRAWREAGLPLEDPVLVLGAGGAAAAALVALEGRPLRVAARRPEAALRLIEKVAVDAQPVVWGEPFEAAVVVNTTPLGMHGEHLPPGLLEASTGLFDMAYGDQPTPAVAEARRRRLPVADGPTMLVAQAAASFGLWTGLPAPIEVMRRAIEISQAG